MKKLIMVVLIASLFTTAAEAQTNKTDTIGIKRNNQMDKKTKGTRPDTSMMDNNHGTYPATNTNPNVKTPPPSPTNTNGNSTNGNMNPPVRR